MFCILGFIEQDNILIFYVQIKDNLVETTGISLDLFLIFIKPTVESDSQFKSNDHNTVLMFLFSKIIFIKTFSSFFSSIILLFNIRQNLFLPT